MSRKAALAWLGPALALAGSIALFTVAGAKTSSCGTDAFSSLCRLDAYPYIIWGIVGLAVTLVWAVGLGAYQMGRTDAGTDRDPETSH